MPAPQTIQEQQESIKNFPSKEDFTESLRKALQEIEETPKEEEIVKNKPSENN